MKKLIYTQEPASSRREDAPYAIKVVIQTDAILQPVSIAVKCNVDVVAGEILLSVREVAAQETLGMNTS